MKRRPEEKLVQSSQAILKDENNKRARREDEVNTNNISIFYKNIIGRKRNENKDEYNDVTINLFLNKKYKEVMKLAISYLKNDSDKRYFADFADASILFIKENYTIDGASEQLQKISGIFPEEVINQLAEMLFQALKLNFTYVENIKKELSTKMEYFQKEITNSEITKIKRADETYETSAQFKNLYLGTYTLSSNIRNTLESFELIEKINDYMSAITAPVQNLILDIIKDGNLITNSKVVFKVLIKIFSTNIKLFESCYDLCKKDPSRKQEYDYLKNQFIDSIGLELLHTDNRRGLKLFCLLFEDDPILVVTIRSFKQIAFPKGYDDPELEYTTDIEKVEIKPTRTPVSALATMRLSGFVKGKEKEKLIFSELLSEEASKQYRELPELADGTSDNAGETNTQKNSPDLTEGNVQVQHISYVDKIKLAEETKNKENVPPKKFTLTQAPGTSGGFRKLAAPIRLNPSIPTESGENKICQTGRGI
ncbi:hypothetical protein H1Q59_06035 [Holosporaceae bacterium 'Namur']|nr:hypothetical protein [Holosporaceae bacterium 'Namur']